MSIGTNNGNSKCWLICCLYKRNEIYAAPQKGPKTCKCPSIESWICKESIRHSIYVLWSLTNVWSRRAKPPWLHKIWMNVSLSYRYRHRHGRSSGTSPHTKLPASSSLAQALRWSSSFFFAHKTELQEASIYFASNRWIDKSSNWSAERATILPTHVFSMWCNSFQFIFPFTSLLFKIMREYSDRYSTNYLLICRKLVDFWRKFSPFAEWVSRTSTAASKAATSSFRRLLRAS